MASIVDLIRALNAPPALGDFSASTTQPWLTPGIGTGPGAQLILKDPAGVQAAAARWGEANAASANPYLGKVWGDSPGQAQGNLLNLRGQDISLANAAAARAQAAQQFNANQSRLTQARADQLASQREAQARLQRNDTLDFLSKLAQVDTESQTRAAMYGFQNQARAAASDQRAALAGQTYEALQNLNQTRETLGNRLSQTEQSLANLPNIQEQFTSSDEYGHRSLGVSPELSNVMQTIFGWAPDSETIRDSLAGARSTLKSQADEIRNQTARASDDYREIIAGLKAGGGVSPRAAGFSSGSGYAPPSGNGFTGGISPATLSYLMAMAGVSPVSQPKTQSAVKPLLSSTYYASGAYPNHTYGTSVQEQQRYSMDHPALRSVSFGGPLSTSGEQSPGDYFANLTTGPKAAPLPYERSFSADAPVTRMQMLPNGELVPASGSPSNDGGFTQALDSSLNKQAILAPLAAEVARLLSVDPQQIGGSQIYATPEAQVYQVLKSLTGGDPSIRSRVNALPQQTVAQLLQNALREAQRAPDRRVTRVGRNI